MFKCTYVTTMRNIVVTKTFLAKSFSSQLGHEREKICHDIKKDKNQFKSKYVAIKKNIVAKKKNIVATQFVLLQLNYVAT